MRLSPAAYRVSHLPLHPGWWTLTDSHQDICLLAFLWFLPANIWSYCHHHSAQTLKTIPNTQGCPTACPSWRVYRPSSHPRMTAAAVFLLHKGFQPLLFVVCAVCRGVDALQLRYWSRHLFRGEALISTRLFGGISSLMSLLYVRPPLHWDTSPKDLTSTHAPSNTAVLPPGLPRASLVLCLSSFKSGLKLFQCVLITQ